MQRYHVFCGKQVIYAGQINEQGNMWVDRSDVTDECTSAVAQWLYDNKKSMSFVIDGKRCTMIVKEEN